MFEFGAYLHLVGWYSSQSHSGLVVGVEETPIALLEKALGIRRSLFAVVLFGNFRFDNGDASHPYN